MILIAIVGLGVVIGMPYLLDNSMFTPSLLAFNPLGNTDDA